VKNDDPVGLVVRRIAPRLAGDIVSVEVELSGYILDVSANPKDRLVEEFKHCNGITVLRRTVLSGESLDEVDGAFDVGWVGMPEISMYIKQNVERDTPAGGTLVARVVVAILRAGSTVQIDQDFDFVGSRPSNSLVEVFGSTLNERFITLNIPTPVANRDTDMIQSVS
jgi:hypothetical protein